MSFHNYRLNLTIILLLVLTSTLRAAPRVLVDPITVGEGQTLTGPVATIDDGSDGTPNSKYITRLTQELFGRNAGARDIALGASVTDSRLAREETAFEWITTPAFFKVRSRQLLLDHFPSYDITGAIDDTVRRLSGGFSEEEIRATLIGSSSYSARFNNNANSILNGFYSELLGRGPNNSEINAYGNWLNSGKSRLSYALSLMQGGEYRQRVAAAAFVTMLGRQASTDELTYWTKIQANGGLRTPQVSASLAGMPEFAALTPTHPDWLTRLAARLIVTNPPPFDLLGRRFETVAGHGQRAYSILTGQEFADIRIHREFASLLRRPPSNVELPIWLGELKSWPGLDYLVPALISTSEFDSGFDFGFVQAAFQAVIGRSPAFDEIGLGTDFLSGGGTRAQYAAYMGQSPEYRTNWAFGILQNDLWFASATNQVKTLTGQLNLGASPVRMRSSVLGSFDYAEKARTNSLTGNFVTQLYQDLLGRNPTNANETLRLASLAPSRVLAVRSVLFSEAYATNTLASYTQTYLKRNPTAGELTDLPPLSLQPGYLESLTATLLGSDEFFKKYNSQANSYVTAVLGFLIPGAVTSDYLALYNANAASRPDFIRKLMATAEYRMVNAGNVVSQWLKRLAGPQEKARLAARSSCGWDTQDLIAAVLAGDEFYELSGGTPATFQKAALASLGLSSNPNIEWPVVPLSLELGEAPRLAAERFLGSLTFRTNLMQSAYTNWLGRLPTTNELSAIALGWTNGANLETQWSDLLGSSNFFLKVGSVNASFITAVAQTVLGRAAVTADTTLFNATVGTNGTRSDYVQKVFRSIEYGQRLPVTLYPLFLRRNPQGAESTNIVHLRLAGAPLESVWAAVATLPDAQALTADSLGITLWTAFTGSAMTADAAAQWAESWRKTAARANFTALWSAFPSVITNRVAANFQTILARAPVKADLDNALALLGNGTTMVDLRALLFASSEFLTKSGGNNTGWVNAIYQKLFARLPLAAEKTFWVQQLDGGLARQTAATSLLGSYEAREQSLRDAGQRILDRPLTEDEVALESAFDRDGSAIVRFLASDERFFNSQATYTATVEWGNGVTNAGGVTLDNGVQHVLGTNTYSTSGVYPLKVIVTAGTTSFSGTNLVTVTNISPKVILDLSTRKYNGVAFSIDGSFTDPGDDTWTGVVNFGDGTPLEPIEFTTNKTFSLSHAYLVDGAFQISVTVTDTHGGSGTAQLQLGVPNQPIIVRFKSDTFDTSTDAAGWLLFSTNGTSEQPAYQVSGGNPGGYLGSRTALLPEGFGWLAPVAYQGNKRELLGGLIAFDLRKADPAALNVPSAVRLTGNSLAITHHASLPSGTNWFRLQFPVDAGSGWTNTATGKTATLADIQEVLNSIRRVELAADVSSHFVGGDLDNFVFAGTDPGPAPLLRIAIRPDGQVLIVWPTLNDSYSLQWATDPAGPWENLSGVITIGADGFRFFRQPVGSTEFYRLIK